MRTIYFHDSSNISSMNYDPKTGILRVHFAEGGVYEYTGVSVTAFATIAAASSVGETFYKLKQDWKYTKI